MQGCACCDCCYRLRLSSIPCLHPFNCVGHMLISVLRVRRSEPYDVFGANTSNNIVWIVRDCAVCRLFTQFDDKPLKCVTSLGLRLTALPCINTPYPLASQTGNNLQVNYCHGNAGIAACWLLTELKYRYRAI